jgi:hypothetical protein
MTNIASYIQASLSNTLSTRVHEKLRDIFGARERGALFGYNYLRIIIDAKILVFLFSVYNKNSHLSMASPGDQYIYGIMTTYKCELSEQRGDH